MAAAAGDEPPAAAPIEPTSFDVVICGTGFPESVLAAACAAAGKTVLHVDPNASYGSLYASSLSSFLLDSDSSASRPDTAVHRRSDLYSDLETSGTAPEPAGGFTVDLVGPRLLYCADEAVDLLLRSGASNHVEFKSLDGGTLLYWDGHLCPVPDSRNAIFLLQDTNNTTRIQRLIQKNRLNTFFKLVESHIAAAPSSPAGKTMISEEDLNLPFVEFLKKQQLPPKMIAVVLYAITMADYDQDAAADSCENLVTTRDGIKAIALYNQSIGRYPNAKGAFIYPMYGHGELPQAFCRFAAVKGALYVLMIPLKGFQFHL